MVHQMSLPLTGKALLAAQVGDFVANGAVISFLTSLPTPMSAHNIPSVDNSNVWTNQGITTGDGTVTPVTSATLTSGVVTAIS